MPSLRTKHYFHLREYSVWRFYLCPPEEQLMTKGDCWVHLHFVGPPIWNQNTAANHGRVIDTEQGQTRASVTSPGAKAICSWGKESHRLPNPTLQSKRCDAISNLNENTLQRTGPRIQALCSTKCQQSIDEYFLWFHSSCRYNRLHYCAIPWILPFVLPLLIFKRQISECST